MHEDPENKQKTTKLSNRIPSRFRRFSDLRMLIFIVIFAAAGVTYLVASHAAGGYYSTTGNIVIMAHDTNGNALENVTVTLPTQQSVIIVQGQQITSGFSCNPDQVTTHPDNNL